MIRHPRPAQGSTLIVAMLIVAAMAALIAAYYDVAILPKYRSTFQAADWQEALHGAEAGSDFVLAQLNTAATTALSTGATPDAYSWTGWTLDPGYSLNGSRTYNSQIVLGGGENVTITSLTVDVYTRDASQTPPSYDPWFRLRSTARADLPGHYVSLDERDAALRRMALSATSGGAPDPHVSRTVEVILKPRYQFTNALVTLSSMTLGNSANWTVDSFDSSDPNKSDVGTVAGGIYPSEAAKVQANGDIATMNPEPTGVLYGPLISGNGATVLGTVSTDGGDDPSTDTHENVSGNSGMAQSRIMDTFDQDFPAVSAPNWSSFLTAPPGNTGFGTGTKSSPALYVVNGSLGAFSVTAPPSGTGYVQILVNGNVGIGHGNNAFVDIPPNVVATVYVTGNIDFGNGMVNSDSKSSQVASHFTVFGVGAVGSTYAASGNAVETLSFYGPNYDVSLKGTVTTDGAMVTHTFSISGGGNGGFHYDEALGRGGVIAGWQVASYFDDAREDPQ
jgi:hypothetical protein